MRRGLRDGDTAATGILRYCFEPLCFQFKLVHQLGLALFLFVSDSVICSCLLDFDELLVDAISLTYKEIRGNKVVVLECFHTLEDLRVIVDAEEIEVHVQEEGLE